MVGVDGVGGLLSTSDIEAGTTSSKPTVRSLLNASLLDDIKRSAIEPSEREADGSIMPPVSFIARNLHVYMMISNMRGIPYKVAFGRNSYGMQTIGDRIHYVVTDLGDYDLRDENSWVDEDARKASYTISVTTLPRRQADQLGEWDLYGTAALASGAFPIGLASRRLSFPWSHYLDRNYPVPIPPDVTIQPSFPPDIQKMYEAFSFESVDGGLVNNDPFDYAQYALVGGPATEPVNGQSVDRAIIMVAPFPEPPEFLPENSPSPAVTAIMRALFPALVNQARFRTSELAPAVNERDFSRYLIAPLRRIPRDDSVTLRAKRPPIERFPIACGLLGGFGGFLDERFRSHDFQLGRRNCQQFLRNSFLVPSDNVIIGRRGMTDSLPVIPLVGSAADPIPLPLWPQMSQRDFDRLCNRMRERLDRVIPALVNSQTPSVKLRTALKLGWLLFLRSRIFEFVRLTMISDLVRRRQIQGWDAAEYASETVKSFERSADDVRAVIAELINPAYDFRTVRGIANCAHMPIEFVEALLQKLSQRSTPEQFRVWANNYGYTHFMRRPGFLGRRGFVQWFNRWWNAPTVD